MTTTCPAAAQNLPQRGSSWRLQRWHCIVAERPCCWPAAHGTPSRARSRLAPRPTFREVASGLAPGRCDMPAGIFLRSR